jgi:hypothetical protein
MDWSMILILLLKHDNSDSNILLLQDPNKHLSSMALILWTTKDQAFILISSLGVNKLFYVDGSSYQQQNPHKILTLLLQDGSISQIRQKFKAKLASPNITTSQHPFGPKNLRRSHKTAGIFLRTKHIPYPIQNPQKHHDELSHNHCKNPRHVHPLPCVNPYRNTCNNYGPLPNILNTTEIFLSGFFSFNFLNQVLLLPIYNTPKSKSNDTFLILLTSPIT